MATEPRDQLSYSLPRDVQEDASHHPHTDFPRPAPPSTESVLGEEDPGASLDLEHPDVPSDVDATGWLN